MAAFTHFTSAAANPHNGIADKKHVRTISSKINSDEMSLATCKRVGGNLAGVRKINAAGPHAIIGLGGIDVTKPYKSKWFGDIDAPIPYDCMGSGYTNSESF